MAAKEEAKAMEEAKGEVRAEGVGMRFRIPTAVRALATVDDSHCARVVRFQKPLSAEAPEAIL